MTQDIKQLIAEAAEFEEKADSLSWKVKDINYENLDFNQFCQITTALESSTLTLGLCIVAMKKGMEKAGKVEFEYIKSLPDEEE